MDLDLSDEQALERERVSIALERSKEIRDRTKRRRVSGALLMSVAVFLLLISWVLVGINWIYVILGLIGAVFFGLGLYELVTEPTIRVWQTLIDEIELSLGSAAGEMELREELAGALERHKDEKVLSAQVIDILDKNQGAELRQRLEDLVEVYRRGPT